MFRQIARVALLFVFVTLTACRLNDDPNLPSNPAFADGVIKAEALRDSVFIVQEGQRGTLPLEQQLLLSVGDGLAVDEQGRASLQLADVLTAELLQAGEITLQTFSESEQSLEIALRQAGGLLLNDFNPEKQVNHSLTIETEFVTVTTKGARFVVAREADNLTWVINLSAAQEELQVTAAADTQTILAGTARWVAPGDVPSASLQINTPTLQAWLSEVRNSVSSSGLSEFLLAPADIIGNVASLTALPRAGQPFELGANLQGSVKLSLDRTGLFGAPAYTLEDCDEDGSQDIAILAGLLHFDFSSVSAQVRALDVVIVNRDRPDKGALWTLDAAENEIARQLFEVGNGDSQILSLRSEQDYHAAKLAMIDGCFAGFSLTPPTTAGVPGPPRSATTRLSSGVVVNMLAESEAEGEVEPEVAEEINERLRADDPIEAVPVEVGALQIDGEGADWEALTPQSNLAWTRFDTVVYNSACANRYPGAKGAVDLSGAVRFAYDEQFLYVAFQVEDEGYVIYSGAEQMVFLGDSPQVSLDMELLSDYTDPGRSEDDWQVDFYPDPASPYAVLWQLGSLSSREFEEASVATSFTGASYFLEAALPWQSLGAVPQPGDRLGLAANVNDNDTPNTNAQECIISTASRREWNDPTTWGILFLKSSNLE